MSHALLVLQLISLCIIFQVEFGIELVIGTLPEVALSRAQELNATWIILDRSGKIKLIVWIMWSIILYLQYFTESITYVQMNYPKTTSFDIKGTWVTGKWRKKESISSRTFLVVYQDWSVTIKLNIWEGHQSSPQRYIVSVLLKHMMIVYVLRMKIPSVGKETQKRVSIGTLIAADF